MVYRGKMDNADVAVKISKQFSSEKVLHECLTLRKLALAEVPNIEMCLCISENEKQQVSAVYSPFLGGSLTSHIVSSISGTIDQPTQYEISRKLLDTVVSIIRAGVVLTDLQWLYDVSSGQLLIIDFTEAKNVNTVGPSFLELQEIDNFISEALAYIPDRLVNFVLIETVENLKSSEGTKDDRMEEIIGRFLSSRN